MTKKGIILNKILARIVAKNKKAFYKQNPQATHMCSDCAFIKYKDKAASKVFNTLAQNPGITLMCHEPVFNNSGEITGYKAKENICTGFKILHHETMQADDTAGK